MNRVQCLLDRFDRPVDGFGNFFVLLVLQRTQVLVNDRNGIGQNLGCPPAIAVLVRI